MDQDVKVSHGTSGPDGPEFPENGRITVDLGALADNWRTLASRLSGGARCGAAVKADGYGLGAGEATRTLWRAGCRSFFVATPQEGARLRQDLAAIGPEAGETEIYVLNGLYSGAAPAYSRHGLRPVLATPADVAEWADHARRSDAPCPAALHVDTGISRLGLSPDEARAVAASGFRPALVISHLACADMPGNPMNDRQLGRFRELAGLFPDARKSLANSAGIFLGPEYHFDLARPGIALYGSQATANEESLLKTVVTLEARILQVHPLKKGDTIGYGAAFAAERDMQVAMVAAGYADGYMRRAGSASGQPGARAWLAGHYLPVLGRVSMDMTAFDVTNVPMDKAVPGALVELFGPHVSVDEAASCAGTIGYEFLTSLGARFARRYLPDTAADNGTATDAAN